MPESSTPSPGQAPKTFRAFVSKYPVLGEAHQRVTEEVESLGPLDARTCALIKIGISLGAGLDSAVRTHVRRASQAGATDAAIEQAILLGMTTVGFPRTVAAWSGAQQQFERDRNEASPTVTASDSP